MVNLVSKPFSLQSDRILGHDVCTKNTCIVLTSPCRLWLGVGFRGSSFSLYSRIGYKRGMCKQFSWKKNTHTQKETKEEWSWNELIAGNPLTVTQLKGFMATISRMEDRWRCHAVLHCVPELVEPSCIFKGINDKHVIGPRDTDMHRLQNERQQTSPAQKSTLKGKALRHTHGLSCSTPISMPWTATYLRVFSSLWIWRASLHHVVARVFSESIFDLFTLTFMACNVAT